MSLEDLHGAAGADALPAGEETDRRLTVGAPARLLALLGLGLLIVLVAGAVVAGYGTGYSYGSVPGGAAVGPRADLPGDPAALKRMGRKLEAQHRQLVAALQKKEPKGVYVVIDQTQNRIYLKKDEQTVFEAPCSAGSGMILKEGEGGKGRKWVFDTPRGLFHVKSKQENPVWKKPDWAFVEEGKPIPKNDEDRFDYGTLGEYSFQLGDGYMIHGTLYERLIGRSVTHGCIRVGRDDLRILWKEVPVGTPVYIY